eukprot:3173363-Rhodomonas_salina.5
MMNLNHCGSHDLFRLPVPGYPGGSSPGYSRPTAVSAEPQVERQRDRSTEQVRQRSKPYRESRTGQVRLPGLFLVLDGTRGPKTEALTLVFTHN